MPIVKQVSEQVNLLYVLLGKLFDYLGEYKTPVPDNQCTRAVFFVGPPGPLSFYK